MADVTTPVTDTVHGQNISNVDMRILDFADIDNTDTWTWPSDWGIPVAHAWIPDTATDEAAGAIGTTAVAFGAAAANNSGKLVLFFLQE